MASGGKIGTSRLNYSRYGYYFILPFFIVYIIFSLYPLLYTFYTSFTGTVSTTNADGAVIQETGFVGLDNFTALLSGKANDTYQERNARALHNEFGASLKNTLQIWLINFAPQILLSLLLAIWFTDNRLKIKGKGFFKVVMYMPNIITAASVAVLFLSLFGKTKMSPVNGVLLGIGAIDEPIDFLQHNGGLTKRIIIAFIQCWMWYGNTMILLIAGVMGISPSLFEAAEIDGASSTQTVMHVTLPLLRPILVYTVMTSMIGGLQMFDVPLLFTTGSTIDPNSRTVAVFIYERYMGTVKNYGLSGAASIILFAITSVLGFFVYRMNSDTSGQVKTKQSKSKLKGGLGL
ncbi:MAG: carbohydrate ABC transporter permease [Huintestinicola sp.]